MNAPAGKPAGPVARPKTNPCDVTYDQGEFDQAVAAQRSTIDRILRSYGIHTRTNDVLELLVGDLWRSLGRWADSIERGPRPSLGAWANGVARNTAHEFSRKENPLRAPGEHRMILLDALPGDALLAQRDGDQPSETAAEDAVRALKALVFARPGGSDKWARLVRTVTHDRRGARARAELQAVLDSVTNPNNQGT